MATFQYPSQRALERINAERMPNVMANRAIFDVLPPQNKDDFYLTWEIEDNYVGLANVRGLDGQPVKVARTGVKSFTVAPGVYGEYTVIGEREITTRRATGAYGTINVNEDVANEENRLLARELDRIELIGWTLLATGTFSVSNPDGTVLHTDVYSPQTFTAAVAWGTVATATPLSDMRAMKLKARGKGVAFDGAATIYMNSATANSFYNNVNSADLYGRRTGGFATVNSPTAVNSILTGDNLPNIVEYDGGYLDSSGTFQLFIPNNRAVLVGRRSDGGAVGNYRFVRNAQNPGEAAGPYVRVIDEPDNIPRHIEVHRGHNGGPVLYYPSAVVIATV